LSVDERVIIDAMRGGDYHRVSYSVDRLMRDAKHADELRRAQKCIPVPPYPGNRSDEPEYTEFMFGLETIAFDVAGALLKGAWLPRFSLYRAELSFGELVYDIASAIRDSLTSVARTDLDELRQVLLWAEHHAELESSGQEAETDD
jgi:hypothetical protein